MEEENVTQLRISVRNLVDYGKRCRDNGKKILGREGRTWISIMNFTRYFTMWLLC